MARKIWLILGPIAGIMLGGYFVLGGVMALSKHPGEYPNWVFPVVAGGCVVAASILWLVKRISSPRHPGKETKDDIGGWQPEPKPPAS